MANWTGMSRTNYFLVRDEQAFREWADTLPDVRLVQDGHGAFALIADTDDGSWPASRYIGPEDAQELEFDIINEIVGFLADGEVAVFVTAGHEKARYATGEAIAINSAGESAFVGINQIYSIAERLLGKRPSRAEY